MRLLIEIIAAILLVCCVSVTSAAYAAGKMSRSARRIIRGTNESSQVARAFAASANAEPAHR